MTDFESSFPGCEEESLDRFPGSVACPGSMVFPGSVVPSGPTQPERSRSTAKMNAIILMDLLLISIKFYPFRDVPRRFFRRLAAVTVFVDLFDDDGFYIGVYFVHLRDVRKKIH